MRCAWTAALTALAVGACTAAKPQFSRDSGVRDAAMDTRVDSAVDADTGTGCEDVRYLECDGSDPVCDLYGWNDPANCGACGRTCAAEERCVAGGCLEARVVDLAMGVDHVCVLFEGGRVVCWGGDEHGQLGEGLSSDSGIFQRTEPVAVQMLDDAVAIEAAANTTCAIRGSERRVVCWGINQPEMYGRGVDPDSLFTVPEPLDFELDPVPIAELSMSGSHIVALSDDGRVFTSGGFGRPQLGRTPGGVVHLLGEIDAPPGPVVAIVAGGSIGFGWTCIAIDDGRVFCVGNNDGEVVQMGGPSEVDSFVEVGGLSNIIALAADQDYACALDTIGDVYCWGDNDHGELGRGVADLNNYPPARVPLSEPAGAIAIGAVTTFAVSADGDTVWGWGDSARGQLGLGNGALIDHPSPEPIITRGGSRYSVVASRGTTCVLERRTAVPTQIQCAGENDEGELGITPSAFRASFDVVPYFAP